MKVSPVRNKNSIKIQVSLPERRRLYWSPGLSWDKPSLERAKAICSQIYLDILSGKFDGSFEPYAIAANVRLHKATQTPEQQINILEAWLQWLELRREELSPTTYLSELNTVSKLLQRDPSLSLSDSHQLISIASGIYSKRTCKNCWKWLRACFNHYLELETITKNPFLRTPKIFIEHKKQQPEKSFSLEEKKEIIKAFTEFRPEYELFVRFLFATGCRPEEAIALTWDDVRNGFIYITKAYSRGHLKDTKTRTHRRFSINKTIQKILDESPKDNFRVFPSPSGGYIHLSNFNAKRWKPLVEKLVEDRKVSTYMSTYHCRHTFISMCLQKKIPIQQIAKWVGNSPEIIWRNYAGVTTEVEIPD